MRKNFRKEFVDEIRKALPDDMNAAIYLAKQLELGKETVYRRLRGTVPFTFDEAAKVATELGISLDRLAGVTLPENQNYEFKVNYYKDFGGHYDELVANSLWAVNKIAQDSSSIYIMAANHLPYCFYAPYQHLTDFRIKRWLYERGEIDSFNDSEADGMSQDYYKMQLAVLDAFCKVDGIYMIWDTNVFRSFVKELQYFRVISLITGEDIGNMKRELLDMLDVLEDMMIKGKTKDGRKVSFYLSNVIFDTSYSYMESKDFQISYFHVYAVHLIQSESPDVCKIQKSWLQTILRHSTLITQSGEIERSAYLKEQRALVESL